MNLIVFLSLFHGLILNVFATNTFRHPVKNLCRCSDLQRLYEEVCTCGNDVSIDVRIANCIFPQSQLPASCKSIQNAYSKGNCYGKIDLPSVAPITSRPLFTQQRMQTKGFISDTAFQKMSIDRSAVLIEPNKWIDDFIQWYTDDGPECYIFRVQEAEWDHGGDVGIRNATLFHQYVHSLTGRLLTPGNPLGEWEPFLPGPTIRGKVGDTICVTIQNRIDLTSGFAIDDALNSTIIHWHGIELANAYDGTPVTQRPIPAGSDFTYRFVLVRAQVAWYHSHWDSLIQNQMGMYGVIVVDDDVTEDLRAIGSLPHESRTFVISLTDTSFQVNANNPNNNVVDVAALPPAQLWTRDITNTGGGNQNFGNIFLINGMHEIPFNSPLGNHQQFWEEGKRTSHSPVVLKPKETVAVHIANNGIFRAYKISLEWTSKPSYYKCRGTLKDNKFTPIAATSPRSNKWIDKTNNETQCFS